MCVAQTIADLEGRLTAMEQGIIYLWNKLGDESYAEVREYIQKSVIPHLFEDGGWDAVEDHCVDCGFKECECEEEVIIQKRIYMCGMCKQYGQQIPKKGHNCPYHFA